LWLGSSFVYSFYTPTLLYVFIFFFCNDTATTQIYTLSLHDALPISISLSRDAIRMRPGSMAVMVPGGDPSEVPNTSSSVHSMNPDRKSTRLNSSHVAISYAVFCLKKKKIIIHRGDDSLRSPYRSRLY